MASQACSVTHSFRGGALDTGHCRASESLERRTTAAQASSAPNSLGIAGTTSHSDSMAAFTDGEESKLGSCHFPLPAS